MKKSLLLLFPVLTLLSACRSSNAKEQLRIKTDANKMEYCFGEDFDATGLEIERVNKDGSVETVTDFVIENGKNLKLSSTVSARSGDLEIEIPISIEEKFKGQITCVGDSLTEGHYWPTESYPTYINGYLPEGSNATVLNCGKNGASFKTFGQYNPAYNTTDAYTKSLTGNPCVLTILLGTNDATNWSNEKDLYVEDYTNLVNEYKTKFGDDLNVIMLTSPRVTTNTFGIPGDTILNEVNPLQFQLAEDLDLPIIDVNEAFNSKTDDELFRDGVHFTADAAQIVANLIAEKIVEIYQ